jgi:basic membrane protein A
MLDAKMTRRSFAATMGVGALAALAGCGGGGNSGSDAAAGDEKVVIRMVTDTGGISDQSFNQLAWAGMQQLKTDNGWDVDYYESKQDSDYATNLDKAVDDGANMVWAIGFAMSDAANESAEANPDVKFGSIEGTNTSGAENLVCVAFKSQDSSFAVGYIAARMSESGKVGFVGGMTGETIAAFEYGYKAGIAYANAEQNTNVQCDAQYAESFTDSSKGSSIAKKMIQSGCDVLFHAAGGAGVGMLDECNAQGVKSIGVDQDQAAVLGYDTIIASALKKVDEAIIKVSNGFLDGSIEAGDIVLGAADDAVGLAPTHDKVPDEIYNAALEIFEKIKAGDIVPPANEADYKTYVASL